MRALEVRVAGWYPRGGKRRLYVNRRFGPKTTRAVKRFQRRFGLHVDGIAGPHTFRALNGLESRDGSTKHFDWSEFDQNRNRGCSARANAYAGTFRGGLAAPRRVRRSVRRLMWRLEAIRKKGGAHPIGINSGFRSVPYNDCIGGARRSQHVYGTAADNRMARVDNHRVRRLARHSQFHGIECYSHLTHNHLDLRIENRAFPSGRHWWWPRRDGRGRDLDASGRPCWGERRVASASSRRGAKEAARSGPSPAALRRFVRRGEPRPLRGAD